MSYPTERTSPAPGRYFIVMNAGSGAKDADSREAAVREVLEPAGCPFRIWRAAGVGELHAFTREAVAFALREGGVVVAAGGDGTINTVAQMVFAAGCPFGILPQGTFNYFSRAHGIPLDTAEATRLLLDGVIRPVQAGLVNDRLFLVNASLGLYPKLLEKREVYKQKFGRTRLVAAFSALATLLTPPPQLVLTLQDGGGGEVLHISTLLVENNPLQLQEVGLAEAEAVRHGDLAAVAVKARGVFQMLAVVLQAALGRLAGAANVSSFPFSTLTVVPLRRKRIKVATDGEVTWMVPPLQFRVAPRPLRLIVPPAAPAGESRP